jgi:hypothetical protein
VRQVGHLPEFVLQVREAGNTPLDYGSKTAIPRVCSRTKLGEAEKMFITYVNNNNNNNNNNKRCEGSRFLDVSAEGDSFVF